jgi:dipeptidyl aminopeptidase/acylaminoacyl peptidase
MKKLLLIAFTLISAAVSAQTKLTPEALWKLGRVADPQLSPDGKMMIYSITNYNLPANKGYTEIYIINLNEGNPKLVADSSHNPSSARWRPDGKKIGFIGYNAKTTEPQLWEMNIDGSAKNKITSVPGGISSFKYAPGSDHLMYTTDIKLDKTVAEIYPDLSKSSGRIIDGLMYRHWNTWHDYAYSHIFLAKYKDGILSVEHTDILKDEKFDAPVQPFGGDEQMSWSDDGKKVAYTCKKSSGTAYALTTNSDIYIYDLATGKTENLSTGMMGYDTDPSYSADGSKLAWLSMATEGYEADKNRIMVYDMKSQTKTEITAGFDQSADQLAWTKDGKNLYFISGTNGTKQVYNYDFKTKAIKQVTQGLHDYVSISVAGSGSGTELVGAKMSISMPAEIFRVNVENGIEAQLNFTNATMLAQIKMGNVEKRMITTTDGKQMLTWVIYPPDFNPAKKYPTLLYCQGGPQSMVSQFFSTRWNFQLMAANGYIVVAPNRRGLPGFGQEWNDQITGDYGGQAMKDYLSAIDEMAKQPFVNKDKLGAVGASFGGYSVYWLAGNHDKRFKAFIAHCGMYNMESWYGSTEEMFFANHDNEGPFWKSPAPKNFTASPHKFVAKWDAPILIIHNEKDFRVPVTQGMEAFTAAQLQNIPSRFLYFPDEGHWVGKPQNSILWQRVFFEWLDKYLK